MLADLSAEEGQRLFVELGEKSVPTSLFIRLTLMNDLQCRLLPDSTLQPLPNRMSLIQNPGHLLMGRASQTLCSNDSQIRASC